MFTCIRQSTGDEITADEANELTMQGVNLDDDLIDKFFEKPVFLRRSHFRQGTTHVRSHFSLKPKSIPSVFPEDSCFDRDYFTGSRENFRYSESVEHREGKLFVGTCGINELYKEDKRLKDNSLGVKYEFVIKLETGKKRIIDVASFLPDGSMEAHEVQLCAITPEELEERTVDYENASISVVWWFGKSANTQSNRDWYYHRFGEVPPIFSFNESRSQSDLNISVDYSGQNLPITLNTLPQNWYWFDFYFASKTRKNSWFKEGGLEDQDVELGYQDILKEFLGAKEKARNRLNNFPSTDELSKVFSLVPGSPVEFVHLSKRIGILKKEFIPDKKSGKWIEQCYEYNIDSIPSVIEESQIEEPVRKIKLSVALLLTGQFMGFVPSHPHYFCRQIPSVRVARCLEVWGKLTFPKLEKGLRMEPKSLSGCLGSLVNKQVVKKKENLWCFISIDPLGIPPLGNPHVIKARARAFQQFFDKERSRKI